MTKSSNIYINYKIYLVYEIIKEINYKKKMLLLAQFCFKTVYAKDSEE